MSFKFLSITVFLFFAIFVSDRANAGLIVGDWYSDGTTQWEYVGSFDLADGPGWEGATPYNGLEAAIFLFGELSSNDVYALSSNRISSYADINNFIINHMAWYDSLNFLTGIHEHTENALANNGGSLTYDDVTDISAFVNDRAVVDANINHVFKTVTISVPEPSTIAVFISFLIGLTAFRLKKLK